MKELGQKVFALVVLATFGYVVASQYIAPYASLPVQRANPTGFTVAESQRMFEELGGKPGNKPVTVFVTSWCSVCKALEGQLRLLGVSYARADIERNTAARDYYRGLNRQGGGAVPFTVVGSKMFFGFQIQQIVEAINELNSSSAVRTATAI